MGSNPVTMKQTSGFPFTVPILRSGILAAEFCRHRARADIAAVFDRSFYLRAGDRFVCVGAPGIGNGPSTLIADFGASFRPSDLGLHPGQPASMADRRITIGDSIEFDLDRCERWRPPPWPDRLSPIRLTDICAALARAAAAEAPREGFGPLCCSHEGIIPFPDDESAACVVPAQAGTHTPCPRGQWLWVPAFAGTTQATLHVASGSATTRPNPLMSLARGPIARFEAWLSDALRTGHTPAIAPAPVQGLIGLGPGLTPSGDDFLVGALALLDALAERKVHAALARVIADTPPASTSALSRCFLRAAAAGHIGEHLHCAVASVISGKPDSAIAAVRNIGHSSGWDMLAGIVTTLQVVAGARDHLSRSVSPSVSPGPATRPIRA
jgi:hypothetical protein